MSIFNRLQRQSVPSSFTLLTLRVCVGGCVRVCLWGKSPERVRMSKWHSVMISQESSFCLHTGDEHLPILSWYPDPNPWHQWVWSHKLNPRLYWFLTEFQTAACTLKTLFNRSTVTGKWLLLSAGKCPPHESHASQRTLSNLRKIVSILWSPKLSTV